ncbi:hypothetical protein MXZ89_00245 [Streptococcus uberis]|uniref:hypothetical protein n=1 Tax=Streptococcus uberis TaxID=1349 RepID=UPI001FF464B4|nr:hypothetical protein [Streptococcus uberis]MCK1215803.1 hypothetical protein [Streptococcus uberis]
MKKYKNIILLMIFLFCFISLFLTTLEYGNLPRGYQFVVFFPIIYGLIVTISSNYLFNTDYLVTTFMYLIIQAVRFVIMPVALAFSGDSGQIAYIHVSEESLKLASLLMIIEFIICTFLLAFVSSKKINKKRFGKPVLTGNILIYLPFLLGAGIIYFIFGREQQLLSFLVIRTNTVDRLGDITDTSTVFIRQVLIVALTTIFLLVLVRNAKRYDLSKKERYLNYSLLAAVMMVSIIVGERRTTQIYTAFCCIYSLSQMFPERRKKVVQIIGGAGAIVLIFMSIYKFAYAFMYSSYFEALNNAKFSIGGTTKMLQSYFSGPQNVAVAIEFARHGNFGIFNFIYDMLRSTVPFNFFVKNNGILTSNSFNTYIYSGQVMTGHLLSSVGYGYICFKYLFFLMMVFNLSLSLYCERKMKQSYSIEQIYLWGYLLMRFAYGVNLSTSSLMNASSIMFITGGLLFLVAKTITNKKGI